MYQNEIDEYQSKLDVQTDTCRETLDILQKSKSNPNADIKALRHLFMMANRWRRRLREYLQFYQTIQDLGLDLDNDADRVIIEPYYRKLCEQERKRMD